MKSVSFEQTRRSSEITLNNINYQSAQNSFAGNNSFKINLYGIVDDDKKKCPENIIPDSQVGTQKPQTVPFEPISLPVNCNYNNFCHIGNEEKLFLKKSSFKPDHINQKNSRTQLNNKLKPTLELENSEIDIDTREMNFVPYVKAPRETEYRDEFDDSILHFCLKENY